jgi:hypothetical protein
LREKSDEVRRHLLEDKYVQAERLYLNAKIEQVVTKYTIEVSTILILPRFS